MEETKRCETCGGPLIRRYENRNLRFCSMACYNDSGRPLRKTQTRASRQNRRPGHPIAPPSGIVAECRVVLYGAIGPGPHPCHWCRLPVEWTPGRRGATSLVADHLDWDIHNNDPTNLVPSCDVCNAHRRKTGKSALIGDDELMVVRPNGSRHRAIMKPCEQCGTEFAAALNQIRTGKGRFCSRSCARKRPTSPLPSTTT